MSAELPVQIENAVTSKRELALRAAETIRDGFSDYNRLFSEITQRAKRRFEERDWGAARQDAVDRIESYDLCVGRSTDAVSELLGKAALDHALWSQIRDFYAELIAPLIDQELNKTFFNTLSRRFFKTRGVDPAIEFVALDIEPTDRIAHPVARHAYAVSADLSQLFERVLQDFPFALAYQDIPRCADLIARALQDQLADWGEHPVHAVELMQTVFYRERRAYLVGRVFGEKRYGPCVIALVNGENGVRADAVITRREHIAILFGYTRSYFHADLPTVGDAVVFLRTLLPKKSIDEIYTVLGRAKQGKTERYRHFYRHLLGAPNEQFVHAEGEKGMVMLVFTLPSYPLVFKLIRDRFAFPKNVAREEVQAKYRLVFHHDRVGRLVDAQEFRFLRFRKAQFAPALLEELLDGCKESVYQEGEDLVVSHCYIERRLRPLNLYIKEVDAAMAIKAAVDYGQAIKDLARSNIFPGDLLLKNFGMSRTGRAIFYDYDELCLVTECRFRALPTARYDDEEMHHGAWYHVDDNDVFPEQFPRFLGLSEEQKQALLAEHGEIFDVRWWLEVQERLRSGGYADIPPYYNEVRLGQ
ncbi:bifunctional isocitrate dehydrogenase kinase/phosphatase [Pseudomarimonas arenosa]|uniref:Isocitrate dehydrogenase kinase/phosphatase n=1 Tax=Pseudomarimonas arenosa TaxID=2774145 RepID=A0AAW3ZPU9_9GAMM|nr:bifunctional isocitrate dehydrogenase kinase/phosphatase [Pseudomarimonas arenosa]MBD8526346.1 bifunctional isocitrate dehydrogenase kinase/phosphatase [Pseudomarimonas arenosa]